MEKKLTLQEIFNRIQEIFGYDMETEEVTEFEMKSLINNVFTYEKIYKGFMDEKFVTEFRKKFSNDPSEREIENALNYFHSGMEIDDIVDNFVDHLICGD